MQRCRQPRSVHFTAMAIRQRKHQAIVKLDFSAGPRALIKIRQIRAATESKVLAIINVIAAR